MKNKKISYMVWRLEDGSRCDYEFSSMLKALDFLNKSIGQNYSEFELYVLQNGKQIFSSRSFTKEKIK